MDRYQFRPEISERFENHLSIGMSREIRMDQSLSWRGEKTPTSKISALLRKRPVLLKADFVLTKDRKRPYYRLFVVKCTRRGLVVKRPGVLSKVQMLTLVLGVGGSFPFLPTQRVLVHALLPVSQGKLSEKGMDQWPWKSVRSFPRDWHPSMDRSSLQKRETNGAKFAALRWF